MKEFVIVLAQCKAMLRGCQNKPRTFDVNQVASLNVYEVDDNRATCSGGAAPLDMVIFLIEREFGLELAAEVSDYLIHPNVLALGEPQGMSIKARLGINDPILLECIELMEANMEEPLTPIDLAALLNVSRRHIERLFQRKLNVMPNRYYLGLRLELCQRLLINTTDKVVDIALACGFKSAPHYSRCYQSCYGKMPSQARKQTSKSD
ncbi:MAG: transcriptional regulator GlxA family with amidase domain [Saprospiraceae bacterium]